MKLNYDIFETELGWMGAIGGDRGLRRTTLPQADPAICVEQLGPELESAAQSTSTFAELRSRVERQFEGSPVTFADLEIDVDDARPFFRAAWAACRTIPSGSTRTYGWLAAAAGSPAAARAAGQAMARNRLPIVIPCHRVVASDGTLGGFGRGKTRLDLKGKLLEIEAKAAARSS